MLESLTHAGSSKSPSAALVAPVFPEQRRLPTDPGNLTKNINLQKRDEINFGNQQRKKPKGEMGTDHVLVMIQKPWSVPTFLFN